MVATPSHIPGSQHDPLIQRVAKLEKALAALGNRTRVSTVEGTLTVTTGQVTLTDVPLLVSGAEIGLTAGDTVELAVTGSGALVIMGKLAIPGSADYGSSNVGHAGTFANASNFALSTVADTVICSSTDIVAPPWANSADLIVAALGEAFNNGTTDRFVSRVRVQSTGNPDHFTGGAFVTAPGSSTGSTYATFADVVPVAPGQPVTIKYEMWAEAHTWAAAAAMTAGFNARAAFYRESA